MRILPSYFMRRHALARLATLLMAVMLCGSAYLIVHMVTGIKRDTKRERESLRINQFLRAVDVCPKFPDKPASLSRPQFYPKGGTGARVNNSEGFDAGLFVTFCYTTPPLTAILPVYSAVGNFDRRTAIRDSIGRQCQTLNCKVVFIVGFSMNEQSMQRLKIEYENYRDILIVNKVDTYRDLNDKAFAMLDWLIVYCYEAKYVIHFIDDTYVNVEMFLEDLAKMDPAIYGVVPDRPPTARDQQSKVYVNPAEYPYETFPKFVVGNAYAFPNSLTYLLRCAVPHAIYIWIEDIWLTGHVREVAGIPAIHTSRQVEIFGRSWQSGPMAFEDTRDYLFIHPVQPADFDQIKYHMERPRR